MKTQRPFFIVGSPRSGTTLLQAMLTSSQRLFVPAETHFLEVTRYHRQMFGDLTRDAAFDRLMEIVRKEVVQRNELPVDWSALQAELRQTPRDYAALFDVLLYHMQQRQPEPCRIGEKTPHHLLHVDYLLEHFTDAKIITIIRDARDVAASHRQAFGSTVLQSAVRWRRDQREHRRLTATLPAERYTAVRYEDLVTAPEAQLRRLCDFLEEPFDPVMLSHHTRSSKGFTDREKHKLRTLEPVTAARIGRYRTSLTTGEIAVVQTFAGQEMAELGYALERIPNWRGYFSGILMIPQVLARQRASRRRVRAMAGEVPAN